METVDLAVFGGAVDLLMLSMALAFAIADRQSPNGQVFVAALALMGMTSMSWLWERALGTQSPQWTYFFAPGEWCAAVFAEWYLRVMRTSPVQDRWTRVAEVLLRCCQVSVLGDCLWRAAQPIQLGLALAIAGTLPVAFFALPLLLLLRRQPDLPERQRISAIAAAAPFFVPELLPENLGEEWWIIFRLLGVCVAIGGSLSYYMTQGQRSQFLSRFLSPGVGKLVGERGLMQALQRTQLEITVLCCDLRGFTAFTEKRSSADVVQLLEDYYNAVCAEVARVGGTVKDFAGDGILILVGAPVAQADHAQRGLELARASREAARKAIAKWASAETPLGIGVGVASGRVTVGVIDAAARLEYTAVGTTVNLAARLCGKAQDGEVLISARTAELAGKAGLEARTPAALKGIGAEVVHFRLDEVGA